MCKIRGDIPWKMSGKYIMNLIDLVIDKYYVNCKLCWSSNIEVFPFSFTLQTNKGVIHQYKH